MIVLEILLSACHNYVRIGVKPVCWYPHAEIRRSNFAALVSEQQPESLHKVRNVRT